MEVFTTATDWFAGIAAVLICLYIAYGGFQHARAGDNPQAIFSARAAILRGAAWLVIALSSHGLVNWAIRFVA